MSVTKELESRVAKIQKMLPEGVSINPYLNRSELVSRNISTVIRNLIEGAIIVFLVLILFLGNVRAGLIVASVIPLAMLFAFILMRVFGVSANLMSLGAIDFGIVVDGSIVIVEGILAHIYGKSFLGKTLSRAQMDEQIIAGAGNVVRSATFAVLIILIVFFPDTHPDRHRGEILYPDGPDARVLHHRGLDPVVDLCAHDGVALSQTPYPRDADFRGSVLRPAERSLPALPERMPSFRRGDRGGGSCCWPPACCCLRGLGAEFIPTLDEGDFAMQMTLPAGSSLTRSIVLSERAEKILMDNFPEIRHVVAKIGTAEVPPTRWPSKMPM